MESLTTIELRTCKWLGILALASSAAAKLYALARTPDASLASFSHRETARYPSRRTKSR